MGDIFAQALAPGLSQFQNVTRALVTINTNTDVRADSFSDLQRKQKKLIDSLRVVVTDPVVSAKIFGAGQVVGKITVEQPPDIEIGPNTGYLHTTMILRVEHDVDRYRIGAWQRPMQEELKKLDTWNEFAGAWVSAELLRANALNYSRKDKRARRRAERPAELRALKQSNPAEHAFVTLERRRLEARGPRPARRRAPTDTGSRTVYPASETKARRENNKSK